MNSYSGQFFRGKTADTGLSQAMASEVINLSRLMGISCGVFLLRILGRKTLILFSQTIIVIGLTMAWYLDSFQAESELTIVGIICVLIGFQFGTGSIPWIYIAETCNDRAASVAAITNWTGNLIIVIVAPYLYTAANGYMWLIYALFVVASIYMICNYMKETKGLSEEQVKKLYRRNDSAECQTSASA